LHQSLLNGAPAANGFNVRFGHQISI